MDTQGNYTYTNLAHARILGLESETELIGRNVLDFIDPAIHEEVKNSIQQAMETGEFPSRVEYPIIRNDGSRGFVEVRAVLIKEEGTVIGSRGLVTDITKRKEADKKLYASEKKYRDLYHNAPDLYDTSYCDGNILDINETRAKMLGYTREELLGQPLTKIVAPDLHNQINAAFIRKEMLDKTFEQEIPYLRKDGSILWCHLISNWIKDRNGKPIYSRGVSRDITERKEAREIIYHSIKEKDVLLKEIHHRVKNNLQVISSLLNLQSKSIKDAQNQKIFNNTRDRIRSISMVHEALYQTDDYSNVNFKEYLKNLTGQLIRSVLGGTLSVSLELELTPIKLNLNKAVPCGIVVNELVTNALKHAFPGKRKGAITISLKKKKGQLELIVADNGIGIQKENIESETLGMSLVSILVKNQLNGTLEIDEDEGTIVKIQFPI